MRTWNDTTGQLLDRVRALQLDGRHCAALSIIDNGMNATGPDRDAEFQLLRSVSFIAQSRFRKAAGCLMETLSSHSGNGDKKITLECFHHLAEILYLQNNFQEAQDLLENVLLIYGSSSQKKILVMCTCLLGETIRVWNYGKPAIIEAKALPLIETALETSVALGYREGEAQGLSISGLIFMNLGDHKGPKYYQDAGRCFRKSLDIFREIKDRTKAAWQEYNIGALLAQTGDGKRGTEYILGSADYMQKTGNRLALAWHYYSLAHINADMLARRDSVALGYYTKALDLFDDIRDEIAGTPALNKGFFEEVSDAYQRFAGIVAGNGPGISASAFDRLFTIIERSKAGMLLRQLSWKHSHAATSIPSALQAFSEISDAHKSIVKVIESFFYNAIEESGANTTTDRISLEVFQKRILREDEVFVSFYCAVRTILCLIITPDGVRLERIEGWRECWESIVRLKNSACDDGYYFTEAANRLGNMFNGIIETMRRTGKKIIISPDVQISHIPFDSLPCNDRYPLLGSEITSIHSASVLAKLRELPAVKHHAPFGMYVDSMTRITTEAAKQLCRDQFGTICGTQSSCAGGSDCATLMLGSDPAELATFLSTASECLHIISHGIDGEQIGEPEAAIMIGPEKKLLTADKIASLSVSSKLVVLSACKSAAGRTIRGEGIDSVCNAFFAAGARCVIAALWPIYLDDAVAFNRLLFSYLTHDTIGNAFSRAKLEVAQAGTIRRTHEWAPFILYGNSEIHLWR